MIFLIILFEVLGFFLIILGFRQKNKHEKTQKTFFDYGVAGPTHIYSFMFGILFIALGLILISQNY
jgi:hypothetical protein